MGVPMNEQTLREATQYARGAADMMRYDKLVTGEPWGQVEFAWGPTLTIRVCPNEGTGEYEAFLCTEELEEVELDIAPNRWGLEERRWVKH